MRTTSAVHLLLTDTIEIKRRAGLDNQGGWIDIIVRDKNNEQAHTHTIFCQGTAQLDKVWNSLQGGQAPAPHGPVDETSIVAEAIATYRNFMLEDDYDYNRALCLIMERMIARSENKSATETSTG